MDIEDIQNLRSIIGKHVYNREYEKDGFIENDHRLRRYINLPIVGSLLQKIEIMQKTTNKTLKKCTIYTKIILKKCIVDKICCRLTTLRIQE